MAKSTKCTLLHDNPSLDVNNLRSTGQTALHSASYKGHIEVVKLLLAHPAIKVNIQNLEGFTPFSLCCINGKIAVARELLKDPRVNITLEDNWGCTPLWGASCYGERGIVEWLIASGKHLGDLGRKGGIPQG